MWKNCWDTSVQTNTCGEQNCHTVNWGSAWVYWRYSPRKVGTKKDIHRRILTRARKHKCRISGRAKLEKQSSHVRGWSTWLADVLYSFWYGHTLISCTWTHLRCLIHAYVFIQGHDVVAADTEIRHMHLCQNSMTTSYPETTATFNVDKKYWVTSAHCNVFRDKLQWGY